MILSFVFYNGKVNIQFFKKKHRRTFGEDETFLYVD